MKRLIEESNIPASLPDKEIKWFRRILINWGRRNYRKFPWRSEHKLFHCLIAEILLQRTRADQVVPVYTEFKRIFPDPESLACAGEIEILEVIRPLGLAWRCKFLKRLGAELINGIPKTMTDLLRLSGVGNYAAGAYLSLHTGGRSHIVDSNIVRLYGRYFGFKTDAETRRKKSVGDLAILLTPPLAFRSFNYALLDFCALVCMLKPSCGICPLRFRCNYFVGE